MKIVGDLKGVLKSYVAGGEGVGPKFLATGDWGAETLLVTWFKVELVAEGNRGGLSRRRRSSDIATMAAGNDSNHDCLEHSGDLNQVLGWPRDGGVPPHLHRRSLHNHLTRLGFFLSLSWLRYYSSSSTTRTSGHACTFPLNVSSTFLCIIQVTICGQAWEFHWDTSIGLCDDLELLLHGQLPPRPPLAQSAKSASPQLAFEGKTWSIFVQKEESELRVSWISQRDTEEPRWRGRRRGRRAVPRTSSHHTAVSISGPHWYGTLSIK